MKGQGVLFLLNSYLMHPLCASNESGHIWSVFRARILRAKDL
jgi:hypothetical protein